MGLMGCFEASVRHYRYSLRKGQVEGSSYIRYKSLKSWLYNWCSGLLLQLITFSYMHMYTHKHIHRWVPLDEWSACYRDLYLTTHSTHNRQTSMSTTIFEPTISVGERPQINALDRGATRENSVPPFFGSVILPLVWSLYRLSNPRCN